MKYLPCNAAVKCQTCSNFATSIVQHGNVEKEYPLCEKCKGNLCFVRVAFVLHTPKIKRCGKTKKNVEIIDPKKSPVRFVTNFRELAVEQDNELVLLSGCRYPSPTSMHLSKDERHAVDYLLDNPPINSNGVIYQVQDGLDKYGQNEIRTIFLSNTSNHHWAKTRLSLERAYHKLNSRRTSYLQRTGGGGVMTKNQKQF